MKNFEQLLADQSIHDEPICAPTSKLREEAGIVWELHEASKARETAKREGEG